MNSNYELAAQQAAELHIEACWAMENDDGPEPENLAGPFCGCPTCEVREILSAAYPFLRAGWEAEERDAAKAKAWDEGYELRASTLGMSSDPNPYRA